MPDPESRARYGELAREEVAAWLRSLGMTPDRLDLAVARDPELAAVLEQVERELKGVTDTATPADVPAPMGTPAPTSMAAPAPQPQLAPVSSQPDIPRTREEAIRVIRETAPRLPRRDQEELLRMWEARYGIRS